MTLARLPLLAALAVTFGPGRAGAVQQRPAATDSVVDRILAVVGTKAILQSHVEERLLQEIRLGRSQAPPTPEARAAVRKDLLNVLINEELMVQEAGRDTTIKVLDDDVTKAVEALLRSTRGRYANEEEWRRDIRVAGFDTPDEYRSWLTEQQRRRLEIQQLMSKLQASGKMKSVAPTENEIRAYFDEHKAAFPKRSETISFRQIVVAPPPSDSAKRVALALADSILAELRKGADFATTARRFSMDVGSREAGGEIGWVRRGAGLDPRFEEVAFSLRPGVVSNPVETPFGYHLIQVERSQPAEIQVRHILIMPTVDAADADSAKRVAERIRAAVEQGASFDSLQRIWHDRSEERELDEFWADSLPASYREAVHDVEVGKPTPVFRLEAPVDPLRSKFVVLLITGRKPAGDIRYEDVREQIRSALSEQLTQQRYIDKLREATLVDIRPG